MKYLPHDAAVCYKFIHKDHFIHIVIEAPHLKLTELNIYGEVIVYFMIVSLPEHPGESCQKSSDKSK